MYGNCVPDNMEDSSQNKILFPIYRGCASPRLGAHILTPANIVTTSFSNQTTDDSKIIENNRTKAQKDT